VFFVFRVASSLSIVNQNDAYRGTDPERRYEEIGLVAAKFIRS